MNEIDYRDTRMSFACGCGINHDYDKGMEMHFCKTHKLIINGKIYHE